MSEIRASIDIGSNSVLLLIAQLSPFKELEKLSEVTALGKNLDKTGVFSDESMKETHTCLIRYLQKCESYGIKPDKIISTATEASRVAKNAKDFFKSIEEELNLKTHIISSKREANLTAKGVLLNTTFETPEVYLMDIGGASTELIKIDTKSKIILDSLSLPIGSVRATDWLKQDIFTNAFSKIFSDYSIELDKYLCPSIYCVAGTMTSIGNMHLNHKDYQENEVHGMTLEIEDIEQLFKKCSAWSLDQFNQNYPFLGKRVEAIRGGLILATHLLQRLRTKHITISTYGLRYGSLMEGPETFLVE